MLSQKTQKQCIEYSSSDYWDFRYLSKWSTSDRLLRSMDSWQTACQAFNIDAQKKREPAPRKSSSTCIYPFACKCMSPGTTTEPGLSAILDYSQDQPIINTIYNTDKNSSIGIGSQANINLFCILSGFVWLLFLLKLTAVAPPQFKVMVNQTDEISLNVVVELARWDMSNFSESTEPWWRQGNPLLPNSDVSNSDPSFHAFLPVDPCLLCKVDKWWPTINRKSQKSLYVFPKPWYKLSSSYRKN